MCSFAMPWMVCLPLGIRTIKNIGTSAKDAAHEKHVPVVETERDGHVIRARVGSVEHPSLPEHYIEWIALEAEGRLEVHYLQPGMKPATFFAGGSKTGTVYAYCNLHGLWSATF